MATEQEKKEEAARRARLRATASARNARLAAAEAQVRTVVPGAIAEARFQALTQGELEDMTQADLVAALYPEPPPPLPPREFEDLSPSEQKWVRDTGALIRKGVLDKAGGEHELLAETVAKKFDKKQEERAEKTAKKQFYTYIEAAVHLGVISASIGNVDASTLNAQQQKLRRAAMDTIAHRVRDGAIPVRFVDKRNKPFTIDMWGYDKYRANPHGAVRKPKATKKAHVKP